MAGRGRNARAAHPGSLAPGLALGIALLTLAVYAPVGEHRFISFDDYDYVAAHPHVSRGLTWDGLVWAWTGAHGSTWHPLTSLSHMLDVELFGLDPGWHHLVNAAIHAANAALLFLIFSRMTGRVWPSAWVAGIFALHPLHVESVAWISERKDVLSGFFWLATMGAYLRYARRPGPARYGLLLLAYVAALLSKPMVVTLPFVLLLLDFWPLRRFASGGGPTEAERVAPSTSPGSGRRLTVPEAVPPTRRPASWLVIEKLPLFLMAAILSVVTYVVQQRTGAVGSVIAFSWWDRVANALVAYGAYIGKALWPANLALFYPFEVALPLWQVAGAILILAAITAAVAWQAMRRPYGVVGWLWFVGTLVPVIGLVQVGQQAMADRYTYIPLIGLSFAVAWGMADMARLGARAAQVVIGVAVVAVVACGVSTARQISLWADDVSLFEHAVAVTRRNALAHNILGTALVRRGRVEEAIRQYAKAIEIQPEYALAHSNLGQARATQGRVDEAIGHYEEALRLQPDLALAHNNRGAALHALGRLDEAIAAYREALRIMPEYAEAHSNLGAALAVRGDRAEAIEHFRAALRIRPGWPSALANLERALREQASEP